MLELLPVFAICLFGALITDALSLYDFEKNRYVYQPKLVYLFIVVTACIFCGLRRGYNDTFSYRHLYEIVDTSVPFFSDFSWRLSESFGFKIAYKAMAFLGWDSQVFLMIFALFDVGVVFWFAFRHSRSLTVTVFLLFATGIYTFCFAAIMQCTATAIALIGVDNYLRNKKVWFILFVLIGCTFHTYCILYLIVPLMVSPPWNQRTYEIIFATLVIAVFFTWFIRIIVGITSATGETYTEGDFTSGGVNVFRALVSFVTPVLSFFVRNELKNSRDRVVNISINLSIVQACIMFLGLFGTANYFARLANYFLIFQCIALPFLIDRYYSTENNGSAFMKHLMIAGYSGYFFYAEAIANGGFDALFTRMTLGDFVSLLLR